MKLNTPVEGQRKEGDREQRTGTKKKSEQREENGEQRTRRAKEKIYDGNNKGDKVQNNIQSAERQIIE
jgi:hypothetical protein